MIAHPLLSVWTQPRRTVRAIIAEDPKRLVLILAMLEGINQSLDRAANHRTSPAPLPVAIAAVLVIGPLSGLFSLWLGSWLVHWTGQWMNGVASSQHLRTAFAWAAAPSVLGLLLWVPRIAFFGADAFTDGPARYSGSAPLQCLVIVLGLADMTLAIWGLMLVCNTVAEVQGFRSAWQGFANLFVAGVVIAVPIILSILVSLAFSKG